MDEQHPIRQAIRWGTLALILLIGAWALWPPPDEDRAAEKKIEAKYVIQFSPGANYKPGYRPYDIGEPLTGLNEVIDDFEELYPDTRVEFIDAPLERSYIVTQLSSGQAPDIINQNVEDVWIDVHKNWYVPLDRFLEAPNPFVREKGDSEAAGYEQWWDMFKYQAISRGKAAPDGLNYCLSFDMVETGIFYNKDLFEAAGAEVPTNWPQFLEACEKLSEYRDEDGDRITPMAMNIDAFSDWTVDLTFDQLYYGILRGIDLKQDPVREAYLEGYLDWDELAFLYKKGFFNRNDPRYVQIWKVMREFRQYVNRNLGTVDLTREFVTQSAAMLWQGSWMVYRLKADPELGFDWGVFYLPPFTTETSEFATNIEWADREYVHFDPDNFQQEDGWLRMCVIGGSATQLEVTNRAVSDMPADMPWEEKLEKSERLQRVIAFLQFLSMPENYRRVVNEYPCFLPNIVGVDPLPALEAFARILDRRYTSTKWVYTFDLKFSFIQRRMLEMYLNRAIDLEEYMDWQERNLDNAVSNLLRRKEIDMETLQAKWEQLAPVRAKMEGLPHGD